MDYYINVTDELLANDIIPMVTLFHWDLPQPLEDVGGWLNDTVIGHFHDYADRCFGQLGDKVGILLHKVVNVCLRIMCKFISTYP